MPIKKTTEQFIKDAIKIHNNKYDYSKIIYKNCFKKICIICPIHGEFLQRPINHLQSKGCFNCRKYKSNTEEFIEKSKLIHGNKYDYSKVNYIKSNIPVEIICSIHGSFFSHPSNHLRGNKCKKCSMIVNGINQRLNTEEFIEKSKLIHGEKYLYENVDYIKNNIKVIIICKFHGIFLQRPEDHLDGRGCPKCNESIGEKKIRVFLETNKIKYEHQKSFSNCINPKTNRKLKFDFYIPSKNLLIEYDGEQHFSLGYLNGKYKTTKRDLKSIQYRDKIKNQFSKNNGIELLRIPCMKIKLIEKILIKKLLYTHSKNNLKMENK